MKKNETDKRYKKVLKIVSNIIYVVVCVCAIILLLIVGTQRASNNKNGVLGFRIFNIVTGSMVPEYVVGDVLLVREIDPKDLKVGDDISYKGEIDTFKDKIVTHRIIEKKIGNDGKYTFITQGIANSSEDPEINEDQIFGIVKHKLIILSFISKLIVGTESKFLLFLIPIIIAVAIYFIKMKIASIEILKVDEKEDKKDNEIDFENIDIDSLTDEELEALLEEDEKDDFDEELDELEQEELAKIMEESKSKKRKK